jgi:hypothetical protein
MTLSGSTDVSMTRDTIIAEALELLGVYAAGETIATADYTTCAVTLENMTKFWASIGVGLWKYQEIAVFQSYGGYEYDIGLTGDHATSSYVKTEIKTAAAAAATSIVVDSITGITDGDYIGIELDDGTLQWTTIDGTPSSYTIALDDALTDSVAVDNHVYTYTTKTARPLSISNPRLHYGDGDSEIPLDLVTRKDYFELPDKTTTGEAYRVFYEPLLANGKLYVSDACGDVKNWLVMTAKVQFDDFDSSDVTPDFPQEWFVPITYNLAMFVAPKFKATPSQIVTSIAAESFSALRKFDKSYAPVFMRPA